MKVITLIPVKNESWILRFSLRNFSLFSDEILILDDTSTDTSRNICLTFPKVTVIPFERKEEYVDMSLRRSMLLEEGRKRGGTHFVMLDADEAFSQNFIDRHKEYLEKMRPGEMLTLPWILVGGGKELVYNQKQKQNFKDFIFCDDKTSTYKQQFLSESRTPGSQVAPISVSFEQGCVYHFQNLAKKRNQYKQAWYRINELLKGERSARKINATYDYTKNLTIRNAALVEDTFTLSHISDISKDAGYEFYLDRIQELFNQKGVVFFEDLDIWHIQELRRIFVEETQREPRAKVFPQFILTLNTVKNYIKNWKWQNFRIS